MDDKLFILKEDEKSVKSYRICNDTAEILKLKAKEYGVSQGKILDTLVKQYLK